MTNEIPVDWETNLVASTDKKYRPSNATEGDIFFREWCRCCQRDRAMREGEDVAECDDGELCGIIAATFRYDVDDERYPQEWRCNEHGGEAWCTAFVPAGETIPPPVDTKTLDLFEGALP